MFIQDKNGKYKEIRIENKTSLNITTRDTLIFKCNNCGNKTILSGSGFRKRGIDIKQIYLKDLICAKCFMKNNYGVENNFQRDDIKKKIKRTNIEKYGVDSYTKTEEYKEKSRNTSLEKYGTTSPMKNESIKKKSIENKIEKNGWLSWFSTEEFKESRKKENFEKIKKKLENYDLFILDEKYKGTRPNDINQDYSIYCNICGTIFIDNFHGKIPKCPICYPKYTSLAQKEIENFIGKYEEIQTNIRDILEGKEIDIYIPSKKIGIEFDGLYWHSENNGGKLKSYHLNKTLRAEEKGIKLIHIFEDEWINKKEIVKSILLNILFRTKTIGARKTKIKKVSNKEKKEFLENNHLQGDINGNTNIGLFYKGELVSLLVVGKPRFNKVYDWEILRFANKINLNIIGGFAKLLKYFEKNHEGFIITYSDLRYFNGNIYLKNGFEFLNNTEPNYYYIDIKNSSRERENRIKYQKHKLKYLLENFNENFTEYENMINNGYDIIWDCGNKVFHKLLDNKNSK